MTAHDLTPVQEIAGMYFKRDDLYTPFGAGGVNGGKLRQCMLLIEAALGREPGIKGVITYCSLHSPQGPITAAAARHYGLPCVVAYGGASDMSVATGSMPRLAMSYGASVQVIAKSGRHNVLKQRAEALAKARGLFVVQYGINLDDYGEVLLSAVSEQVQNIPDDLDDLISTAFDRREKVRATIQRYGAGREFIYHDLFHTPGFVYEKQQKMRIGGLKLHPQYEAKTMKYLLEQGLNTDNALFWIVGAEPRER